VHSSLWLSALLVVPLLGSLGAALGRGKQGLAYAVAVASAVVEMAIGVVIFFLYNAHVAGAQTFDFATRHVVSAPFGLAYDVALDGISLFMVELTAIVVLLALLGGRDKRREPAFVSWLLILTSFTMGSFVAHDLLEFFIFFELTLVPCYFIISGWGGKAENAARRRSSSSFTPSAPRPSCSSASCTWAWLTSTRLHGQALTFAYGVLSSTSMTHGDRDLAVHRLRDRLRRQGTYLATAHLVATDLRRGADGGIHRALGAARQTRLLRTAAFRGRSLPPGARRRASRGADPGGHRHPVRLDARVRLQGPQAFRRVQFARSNGLSSRWA
jgi:hypothetical protein